MPSELLAIADLDAEAQHLTRHDGQPALLGGECDVCNKRFFPKRSLCPYCASPAPRDVALPQHGVLYSYTVVHVSSGRPTPYKIGYVDLDRDVRVLAAVQDGDQPLSMDGPVRLVVLADGAWAFESGLATEHTNV